ncbi:MAG: hypothetical protein ACRD9L_20140, partial [Bryobacteraceae bacterium]
MTRALLVTYAVANAIVYSMLLPLWEGFDEPFHFGYVQELAKGRGIPDPRTSCLSREVGLSLSIAPGSSVVQQNLPEITTYVDFFKRQRRGDAIRNWRAPDRESRWQSSQILNYEAQQAPLAYAVLAIPERVFAFIRLPTRV